MVCMEGSDRNKVVIARLPRLLETPDETIVRALFTEEFRLHDAKFRIGHGITPARCACSRTYGR